MNINSLIHIYFARFLVFVKAAFLGYFLRFVFDLSIGNVTKVRGQITMWGYSKLEFRLVVLCSCLFGFFVFFVFRALAVYLFCLMCRKF